MYAIMEANAGYAVGVISADKHAGEWWRGDRWTPASDEAKVFESELAAEKHAAAHCTREYAIVEVE